MAERAEWVLTTEQFRLLWDEQNGAAYPMELAPLGLQVYENADRQRLKQQAVLADLRRTTNELKKSAMRSLTHPRYSIGVTGLDASKPFADTSHHMAIVSAWGGAGEQVVVATQKPGRSPSQGGDVVIRKYGLTDWTRRLVALLPHSGGPGRLPADYNVEFRELAVDVDVLRQVSTEVSKSTAAAAFVHRTPTTCGSVRVQVGSEADGRRPTTMTVNFRDIEDDGRYLLIVDSPGSALGVDDATMAATLNRVINATKKLHEKRVSAGWE